MNDKDFRREGTCGGPVTPIPILPAKTQRIREMLMRAREQQLTISSLLNNFYSQELQVTKEGTIKCEGKGPQTETIVSRLDDIESELESLIEFGDTNITKLSQLV